MKHLIIILALLTATIQTFAQSPRIKLNQITKDSLTGSVLISSPSDSGMVYSRDLFISYGADTFLILGGDTIVLQSDLVEEIGDSLLNYVSRTELSDSLTFYVSRTELSDSTTNIRTDIPLIIADSLLNYVNISGTQTITGAKTFSADVGIGTTSTNFTLDVLSNSTFITLFRNSEAGLLIGGYLGDTYFQSVNATNDGVADFLLTGYNGLNIPLFTIVADDTYIDGNLGIDVNSPTENLDVNGNARFRSIGSGASAGALHYTSTGVLTTNTSDVRLKTNLQPLQNTLNKLLDINTYTFNWINETDRVDLGMVAQEVEEIFPHLVFSNPVDGYKGIHYDKFSSILTKAIQEQQSIIESQATEIESLKTLITELSNRLQILENN